MAQMYWLCLWYGFFNLDGQTAQVTRWSLVLEGQNQKEFISYSTGLHGGSFLANSSFSSHSQINYPIFGRGNWKETWTFCVWWWRSLLGTSCALPSTRMVPKEESTKTIGNGKHGDLRIKRARDGSASRGLQQWKTAAISRTLATSEIWDDGTVSEA